MRARLYRFMKPFALLATLALTTMSALAANEDTRVFEMRTYYAAPGKLDALNARFRDHTCKLFEKHGMTNVGYWTPIDNPDNKLIYVLAYPSRDAREKSWKEFVNDPDWKAASSTSEKDGKLVAKVEIAFLKATDYSPDVKPSVSTDGRVFELRTYTCTPNNLPALDKRFRDHTTALFKKHGMTNLFYWHLDADQPNAPITLVYILAHASQEAGAKSFDTFRADPDWVAAKEASEKAAGGSLTIEGGVKSVFMRATDYSPTK